MKSFNLLKPYFAENRPIIISGIICLMLVDLLQLFIPRVIKWAVDDLAALRIDTPGILRYAFYIVALATIIGIFRYFWRRCLIGTSRRVEEGLRNTLFEHVQTLSAGYFDRVKTGDLMAHATNDLMNIRMAAGMGLVALTDAIFLGTAAIGFMLYINTRLTLLVLIPMPLIVLATRVFSKKMHRRYQKVQESFADLTETVREGFAGIRVVKAYNGENQQARKLENISMDYIEKNISLLRIVGSFFPLMLLLSNFSLAAVLFLGGRQTIYNVITVGDFVAFISYLGILTWPMMALGWVTNLIQRGAASLDRINKILQTRPQICDVFAPETIDRIHGEVVFDDVAFSYQPDSQPVISGINFRLEPGKIMGVVGPPGSGKTSMLNLIARIYDVRQGQVRVDGIDIRKIKLQQLRSQISFVPQEPFLFSGTIRDNIDLGSQTKDLSALIRAAKEACLYETIESFPKGFDTIVGEKGVILSGGQKQRIGLARALMKRPAIWLLDDPISQVDMETGMDIINYIRSMAGKHTIIIVSHRLSAVRFSDQIVVLKNGRITESGTHETLMSYDKYYAKTFRLQELEEAYNAV
ncbi:MAG: ABC transporter ATP-binding protein [Desulfobacterales bacterium]|nr:ABC transporter ATP-binding protein [Desulfobacterales bacterium]